MAKLALLYEALGVDELSLTDTNLQVCTEATARRVDRPNLCYSHEAG